MASGAATVELVTGPVVNEARMTCADGAWITQVVRLWSGAHSADVEMTVGPVPRGPAPQGKEVVTRYSTPLATAAKWATDSNVRDMMPRQRDFRPTWPYQVSGARRQLHTFAGPPSDPVPSPRPPLACSRFTSQSRATTTP